MRGSIVLAMTGLLSIACGEIERRGRPLGDGPGFSPSHLVVPDDDRSIALSMMPVAYSHDVDTPTLEAVTVVKPHVAESREWTMTVSGAQLRVGFAVPTTLSGALVELRRAPVGDLAGPRLGAETVRLRTPQGESFDAGEAAETLLEGGELADVHAGLGGDALAFRLARDLGSGTFVLSVDSAPDDALYGVRVRERDSALVLRLQTDRETYLHGDIVRVEATLLREEMPVTTDSFAGSVRAPEGSVLPLALTEVAPGRFAADHPMDSLLATPGGLWTIHVSIGLDEAASPIRRTAHTAFAYVMPTARLSGVVDLDIRADGSIMADLPLEVGAEGRYAVTGTLWGSGDGAEVPLLMSQSATHLGPGEHSMQLVFDADAVARAGLSPPFVVRDLRLLDQTRLGLLQRHSDGFTIPPAFVGL